MQVFLHEWLANKSYEVLTNSNLEFTFAYFTAMQHDMTY